MQEVTLDLATTVETLGTVKSPDFLETPDLVQVTVHFPGLLSFAPGPGLFQFLPQIVTSFPCPKDAGLIDGDKSAA